MASTTLTTHGITEAKAFSGRGGVHAVLAGWALLIVAAFAALLIAAQSVQHTGAPVLRQAMFQRVSAIDIAPEPGFRGRPY
jgi:hypothetical protein